jgi:hypothetical protein
MRSIVSNLRNPRSHPVDSKWRGMTEVIGAFLEWCPAGDVGISIGYLRVVNEEGEILVRFNRATWHRTLSIEPAQQALLHGETAITHV